jgi:2-succinyl-5-enolpyruvyl-6-hydroxy-3-cyclohexene-1-carboxylate synthase
METTSKRSVQILVAIAKQRGIKHIVFSPGSRNAPLVIGFNSDSWFTCLNIPDERAAAFFALGIMQHTRQPVAICCTSGSAAVNYYPAITEAFYQKLPLVVLTADRPQAWIDQGDGQTIRQPNVYQNHIRFAANLLEDDDNEALWFNKRVINEALDAAIFPEWGPVHINLPFREPLYQTVSEPTYPPKAIRTTRAKSDLVQEDLLRLSTKWNASSRKMIILGQMLPDQAPDELVGKLAEDPSVMVFTESTSNVRTKGLFQCIDRLLAVLDAGKTNMLKPDILLTFGGAVISKRIKSFLRNCEGMEHWHVQPALPHPDTYQALTEQILATPDDFLQQFFPLTKSVDSDYKWMLTAEDQISDQKHMEYGQQAPWSDWRVFSEVLHQIPENFALHAANSSIVRYLQLFKSGRHIPHFCNRGTSGIDGSTSTAAGFAYVSNIPTLLITGDISFFYDSNGFYHKYLAKGLKVLLINNGGGGIFRIIEGPKDSPFLEDFFEAGNQMKASGIAETFGLEYFQAAELPEFSNQLLTFFATKKAAIFEVFTPRIRNAEILASYFKYLKND